ncbi:tRNA adenosine deaminase-associated protein [Nocardioides sp. YIM 152588]|uniref:tRNA adenosine deaminase-associated protein n=1 Tax=Nocardioides sp. YIM 152588 TaxID=3158259 RepID=UPI0032E3AE55
MNELDEAEADADLAVAAYLEDGEWVVDELVPDHAHDVEDLIGALRRFAGEGGAIGMIAVDEDFFLLVRVEPHRARLLLSDITAATEWELAATAVEFLGLPLPEDDEDEPSPAGDLDLLHDLGMPALDLAVLLDDEELYPDEMLSEVARSIGFGEQFDDAVGLTSA